MQHQPPRPKPDPAKAIYCATGVEAVAEGRAALTAGGPAHLSVSGPHSLAQLVMMLHVPNPRWLMQEVTQ